MSSIIIAPPQSILTNVLYVAKNGVDTNIGSIAYPLLTIGAAITAATSGTTIRIQPGTYTENITLKAGVSLEGQQARTAIINGNMIANYSGTVYLHSIDLQASSGDVITFSGANVTNLSLDDVHIDSLAGGGHCINHTATNASSKISADNGAFNATVSGAAAMVFKSSATSAGSIIWEDISARILDNMDNTALSIAGAISFTHTFDDVHGQIILANTAAYYGTDLTMQTSTVAVFTTNSATLSVLGSILVNTSANPAITGAGLLAQGFVGYVSTGYGFNATLNGGAGVITVPISSIAVNGTATITNPLALSSGGTGSATHTERWCGTAGGNANAITLTPSPAITAYVAGQRFIFIASATNTTAATIAISGLSALTLTMGSVALPIGGIISGNIYAVLVESGTSIRVSPYDAVRVDSIRQAWMMTGIIPITGLTITYTYTSGDLTAITFSGSLTGSAAFTYTTGSLTQEVWTLFNQTITITHTYSSGTLTSSAVIVA